MVADWDGKTGFIGKALQFMLPQPNARAIAAAAIGGDQQRLGARMAFLAQGLPPAANALDRENCGIVINANIYPA